MKHWENTQGAYKSGCLGSGQELSWLERHPQRLRVQFLVRACTQVVGSIPIWGTYRRQPVDVSHIDVSLCLSLPFSLKSVKTYPQIRVKKKCWLE